jgi:hypothetical protein
MRRNHRVHRIDGHYERLPLGTLKGNSAVFDPRRYHLSWLDGLTVRVRKGNLHHRPLNLDDDNR